MKLIIALFLLSIPAQAIFSKNGKVGIYATSSQVFSPAAQLHIDAGTATAVVSKFTAGTTTGQTATDGLDVGIDASGNAELRQRENLPLTLYTNNTAGLTVGATGTITFNTLTTPGPLKVDLNGVVTPGRIQATSDITATLPVVNGGTGQSTYTDGQLLIGNTSTTGLSKSTLTAGSNVTITNAGGAITIAASSGSSAATTSKVFYNSALTTALSSGVETRMNYSTKVQDVDGLVTTGSSWVYTVPTTAWYYASVSIGVVGTFAAGNVLVQRIYFNGVERCKSVHRIEGTISADWTSISTSCAYLITAGQTIYSTFLATGTNPALQGDAAAAFISINQIQP